VAARGKGAALGTVLWVCALALLLPTRARAGPLFELTGGGLSMGGFNARVTGESAASTYFNPALLAFADPGLELGVFVLGDWIDIDPAARPSPSADVPEAVRFYGQADGTGLSPVPVPTVWLQEGVEAGGVQREAHPRQGAPSSDELRAYSTVGLVNRLFDQRLVLGLYAMIPLGGFTAATAFYNDEREQFFSNSLHPELYSDRLSAAELAFGVAGRLYERLSLGLSFTLNLTNEATTPTYVPDAARLDQTVIDPRIDVTTAVSPHFGLVFDALSDLRLTATVHTPQGMEIITDVNYLLNNGQQQSNTFTFVHGYLPWSASLGASYLLLKPPDPESKGQRLSVVGGLKFCDWSDYRDRHGERPSPGYRWKQTLTPSVGLRHSWYTLRSQLDFTYVPTPVPPQTGRTNYVDSDRLGFLGGVDYGFAVFNTEVRAGLHLQLHRLASRRQRKLDPEAAAARDLEADELVLDEVPDDAVDRQQIDPATGQYQAAAGRQGLQTNNPGWPGFSSEGWLFGGGVRLSFLF
jgi:long-chain fatty acid transport protein